MKRFLVIAGEYSGEVYGAKIIHHLKEIYPDAEFRGMGGDAMQTEGCTLLEHCHNMAFMGFVEVIKHLPQISSWLKMVRKEIKRFQPDAIILIDYPGFNMKVAKMGRKAGVPVFGFIAPQVWAWKEGRIKKIKRDYTHLFAALPFEPEFYASRGFQGVSYVGHPLGESIAQYANEHQASDQGYIALMPGSRKQELKKLCPVIKELIQHNPTTQYKLAGLTRFKSTYEEWFSDLDNLNIVFDNAYQVLSNAHAALVTSGTATLETALFNIPQVVIYSTSNFTYQIAKRIAKVDYISLPNIILNRAIVKELIQQECNLENIELELRKITDGLERTKLLEDYKELQDKLNQKGIFQNIAEHIAEKIQP